MTVPLVKCYTCAHDRPWAGCGHPQSLEDHADFWARPSEPDDRGFPWCHSHRQGGEDMGKQANGEKP